VASFFDDKAARVDLPAAAAPAAGLVTAAGLLVPATAAEVATFAPAPPDPPEPPAGVLSSPNFETGLVNLSGLVTLLDLPITRALGLLNSLVETTQRLLIPAEGYTWIDDIDHYAAALVVLDKVLAEKLGLPERSGVLALRAGVDSVWLQAELNQSTEAGPQFGRYKVTIVKLAFCRFSIGAASARLRRRPLSRGGGDLSRGLVWALR
jgi:hypothetical protein